jgi:capsular polysaccharide biosynthesis protein
VIVLCVAAVVNLGVILWTFHHRSTYAATARVLIGPSDAQAGGTNGDVVSLDEVATQRVIAVSQPVLAAAAKALGGSVSPGQLNSALSVQPDPGTRVLAFTVDTTDAKKSAEWANAISAAFVSYQKGQALAQSESSRQELSDLSATLAGRLTKLKRKLSRPRNATNTTMQAEYRALQTQIGQVSAQLQALGSPLGGSTTAAAMIDTATAPTSSTTRPILNAVLGLVLGLLLGVTVALLVGSLETTWQRRRA